MSRSARSVWLQLQGLPVTAFGLFEIARPPLKDTEIVPGAMRRRRQAQGLLVRRPGCIRLSGLARGEGELPDATPAEFTREAGYLAGKNLIETRQSLGETPHFFEDRTAVVQRVRGFGAI